MTKLTWFRAWPLQAHTGKIFLVPCLPRCPESAEPVNKANLMNLASSIQWVLLFWFSYSQQPVAACRHRFSYSHEWFTHIWRKNVPILGASRHTPTATLMEGKIKRKKREDDAKFTLMFGRSMKFLAMWTTSLSMKAGAMYSPSIMLSKLKLHRIKIVIKETDSKDPEGKKRLETSDSNKEEEFFFASFIHGFSCSDDPIWPSTKNAVKLLQKLGLSSPWSLL